MYISTSLSQTLTWGPQESKWQLRGSNNTSEICVPSVYSIKQFKKTECLKDYNNTNNVIFIQVLRLRMHYSSKNKMQVNFSYIRLLNQVGGHGTQELFPTYISRVPTSQVMCQTACSQWSLSVYCFTLLSIKEKHSSRGLESRKEKSLFPGAINKQVCGCNVL